jgi:hypothetical protein
VKHCRELHPVTQAISRVIGEAIMGESPASMEREIETILREWRGEPGIDHAEFGWRLTTLRDEMANAVEAGRKHLPAHVLPHAKGNPKAVARLQAVHEGFILAREVLSRLRVQSLV